MTKNQQLDTVFPSPNFITWNTKKKARIIRSSIEAKYCDQIASIIEIIWLHYVLEDFQIDIFNATPLYCDNVLSIALMTNPIFYS